MIGGGKGSCGEGAAGRGWGKTRMGMGDDTCLLACTICNYIVVQFVLTLKPAETSVAKKAPTHELGRGIQEPVAKNTKL